MERSVFHDRRKRTSGLSILICYLELEAGLEWGLETDGPFDIPVRESDFVFSVICEEFGVIFGICLIFVLMSSFILFMDISTRSRKLFNKLLCLGFGVCFLFQVFLSIGGVTKFIPSTGVTIPLVSYGGTSVISTFDHFLISYKDYIC